MALTPKQQRFCEEYLVDLNATQAAIRAGYSKNTAQPISSQNLSKLIIQEEISRLSKARSKRTEIKGDAVLRNLHALSVGNLLDHLVVQTDGSAVIDLNKSPDKIYNLSKYKVITRREDGEDGATVETQEIVLTDRTRNLELLARHLGLFEKDNTQSAAKLSIYEKMSDAELLEERDRRRNAP